MRKEFENEISVAVDTSGRVGSVCIGKGTHIYKDKNFSGMMRHAAELFPTILELLEEQELTIDQVRNVFVTKGPGSFTGLRIGITLAKMMALAANVNIAAVSTLDVIAQNAIDKIEGENLDISRVASIIDAKRRQFFVAVYEKSEAGWQKTASDCMMGVESFTEKFISNQKTPIWLLGEGLKYYQKRFDTDGVGFFEEDIWSAKSTNLYRLCAEKAANGDFTDPVTLLPEYLRKAEAEENWEKKFGTGS